MFSDQRYVLLLLGVGLVALLTAGGMAVRSVSRIWLRHWAEQRLRGSSAALAFLDRPYRLLAAGSAAVSVVVVLLGVLLGAWERRPAWRFATVVTLVVALLVLVGQIGARAIARRWSAVLVPYVLPLLRLAQILTYPVLLVGRVAARPFASRRAAGTEPERERDSLQDLLREGELEGVGERDEIAIITGVVEFGEKRVRDVMTPRDRVFALDASTESHELALSIARTGYSRVPIYRGSQDQVVGMVHAFDVLKADSDERPPLRPVAEAAPDASCSELLFRMLRGRRHLAIVRDPAGMMLGIVTLEDLLEELVGDIRDEHDEPEAELPAPAPSQTPPSAA